MNLTNGEIKLELSGIDEQQLLRIQATIYDMVEQGAFSVKNGRVILHFDHEGNLQIIAFDFIKWRKKTK